MNNSHNNIYTTKEKLDKLETEYYHLQDWFGNYDRLIWTLRSLLFTIYAAVLVFSFRVSIPTDELFLTLTIFSIFFLGMEIFWLYKYWAKRTCRYKNIQDVINNPIEDKLNNTSLIDMDMNNSGGKKFNIFKKVDEPLLFYAGLIIISWVIFKKI